MTVLKDTKTDKRHSLDVQTDAGDFLTTCGLMLTKNFVLFCRSDREPVDCLGCLNPEVKPVTVPSTGRGAVQYRRPKSVRRETAETLKFAHVEIVAALEWLHRGGEDQFLQTALDRAHLSYRFLQELLVQHKRIEPDPSAEDYDE